MAVKNMSKYKLIFLSLSLLAAFSLVIANGFISDSYASVAVIKTKIKRV